MRRQPASYPRTIAVVMDATLARGLLVPATMRLLGRWNWWAPAPLRAIWRHVGLRESETPASTEAAGATVIASGENEMRELAEPGRV